MLNRFSPNSYALKLLQYVNECAETRNCLVYVGFGKISDLATFKVLLEDLGVNAEEYTAATTDLQRQRALKDKTRIHLCSLQMIASGIRVPDHAIMCSFDVLGPAMASQLQGRPGGDSEATIMIPVVLGGMTTVFTNRHTLNAELKKEATRKMQQATTPAPKPVKTKKVKPPKTKQLHELVKTMQELERLNTARYNLSREELYEGLDYFERKIKKLHNREQKRVLKQQAAYDKC